MPPPVHTPLETDELPISRSLLSSGDVGRNLARHGERAHAAGFRKHLQFVSWSAVSNLILHVTRRVLIGMCVDIEE